jgi:glycosyltransferase involved in cell wall biosynthesis
LFAPFLNERYDLCMSSFYGLEGAPIRWMDIPVLPGLAPDFGNLTLVNHAKRFFKGDPRGGMTVTLMDVWVLDGAEMEQLNLACWVPVDHEPAPPKVSEFFVRSGAVPIAMSRFGESMLGRLDPLYCPHGVDCEVLKPIDQKLSRRDAFPPGAFVVGMVAANKGRPSRKGFSQGLQAYLHTVFDGNVGNGEQIPALLRSCGIPQDRVRAADQYTMLHNPYSTEDMARVYNAMDVLMNPSMGEGFGVPVLEAQACGVPAVVTDFSAMSEVLGAGWAVKSVPYWSPLSSWQAEPDVDDIVSALVECYEATPTQRRKLSEAARKHALTYEVGMVAKRYMFPALKAAEQRFEARRPVRIPARRLKVAA